MSNTYRILLVAVALTVLVAAKASANDFDGPFPVKNLFPLFLYSGQPLFETARVRNACGVSLSYASAFRTLKSNEWFVGEDLELTELNLGCRMPLSSSLELGVDVPFLQMNSGFLDNPLAWYHRATGVDEYGRSRRPQNEFLYVVMKNGQPVVLGEDHKAGIGDTHISLKKEILSNDPILSVVANAELPTGEPRSGFGNGSLDTGLGLLAEGVLAAEARWYAAAGIAFPGDLKAYQRIALRTWYYGMTGLEYRLRPRLSLVAQASVQTSPYPDTGIGVIDSPAVLVLAGGRYYAEKASYDLSLMEDPNAKGAVDFAVTFAYRKSW